MPESRSFWRTNAVFDLKTGNAKPESVLPQGRTRVPSLHQDDNLQAHTDDWFACMRSRRIPNGSIETGFAHAVAVIMATRSYREGKKMYWDRQHEEIVDRPVST